MDMESSDNYRNIKRHQKFWTFRLAEQVGMEVSELTPELRASAMQMGITDFLLARIFAMTGEAAGYED